MTAGGLWVVVERRPHGVSLACERLYRSRSEAERAWQIDNPPDSRDLVAVPLAVDETQNRTEYRAVGVPPVDSPDLSGQGYCGDSLRAARISAEQLARHDYAGARVESRQVSTTTTRMPWVGIDD